MYPITARLAASLVKSSQRVCVKADILVDGLLARTITQQTVIDPVTRDTTDLINGEVTVDSTTIQRGGNVTLTNLADVLTPVEADSLLVPLRTEIRLWRGLYYHDRTAAETLFSAANPDNPTDREYVPMATLVVDDVESTWPSVTVTGSDRMSLMQIYRLKSELDIASGTVVTDLIQAVLSSRIPATRYATSIADMTDTSPTLIWDAQDPLGDRLCDLAASIGQTLYVDPMGTFVLGSPQTTDSNSVWTFADGAESTLLPWPHDVTSGANAYNVVVVTGEPQDSSVPVRGEAVNQDPNSALYAAAVGEIPLFFSSPLMRTTAQANLAAQTILSRQGMSDLLSFEAAVHPALTTGDCVHVRSAHPQGLDMNVLLDSFRLPLRGIGPISYATRARVTLASSGGLFL